MKHSRPSPLNNGTLNSGTLNSGTLNRRAPRVRSRRRAHVCLCGALLGLFASLALPEEPALAQALQPPPSGAPQGHAVPRPLGPGATPPNPALLPQPPNRPMRSPHGEAPKEPVANAAADLARGQIEVRVLDRRQDQLAGRTVVLNVRRESIEQGNSTQVMTATTDEQGVARFDGQETHGDFQYQVKISEGPANFVSGPFSFQQQGGVRVFMPTFPVTESLTEAVVLSRGLVAVTPRDDVFSFDVLWRIENYGRAAWVPKDVVFKLPEGFKAVQAEEMQGDGRFASTDDGVKLTGTFPPGKHDLLFRFQMANEGGSSLNFSFPTFLNVGFFKVMVDVSPTMTLKVPDLEAPQETRNRDGQRRLVSARDFLSEKRRGPEEIKVEIAGIPTPSKGRNVAAALAGVIALVGLGQALGRRRGRAPSRTQLSQEDLKRAGDLLLNELIELEQAFEQGAIGRKMRDRTRQQLLEAFARLGAGDALGLPPGEDEDEDERPGRSGTGSSGKSGSGKSGSGKGGSGTGGAGSAGSRATTVTG